uniref:Uncharacterized protein n=1 Tax=Setaria viridis TaxID=4556 RepID=A0A4U6WKY4_SETVI|nr:hypothetical protein SEVIR_1G150632v2 [Setaria viridis]TKW38987.1 hypothetical protein SEVIR_1G150632v2 [Setaria viridis]TKW38988.1 hypothetical protein SEVIR_1G150632v2 [Setaria viridis]TKW38989.1 hypothetical protein SEVIR_1G150632v2 [Setaria viridis]TKW38990.1 hypothetical protein SEVIR_1G150632v2 [Setaria viridis]
MVTLVSFGLQNLVLVMCVQIELYYSNNCTDNYLVFWQRCTVMFPFLGL